MGAIAAACGSRDSDGERVDGHIAAVEVERPSAPTVGSLVVIAHEPPDPELVPLSRDNPGGVNGSRPERGGR